MLRITGKMYQISQSLKTLQRMYPNVTLQELEIIYRHSIIKAAEDKQFGKK